MAMKVKNVQQGYVTASGQFVPIRASADYDPGRAEEYEDPKDKKARLARLAKGKRVKAAKRALVGAVRRSNPAGKTLTLADSPADYLSDAATEYYISGDWDAIANSARVKYGFNKYFDRYYNLSSRIMPKERQRKIFGNQFRHWMRSKYNQADVERIVGHSLKTRRQQNPLPINKFVEAKVKILSSGDVQLLVPQKAKSAGATKGKRKNPKIDEFDLEAYTSQVYPRFARMYGTSKAGLHTIIALVNRGGSNLTRARAEKFVRDYRRKQKPEKKNPDVGRFQARSFFAYLDKFRKKAYDKGAMGGPVEHLKPFISAVNDFAYSHSDYASFVANMHLPGIIREAYDAGKKGKPFVKLYPTV